MENKKIDVDAIVEKIRIEVSKRKEDSIRLPRPENNARKISANNGHKPVDSPKRDADAFPGTGKNEFEIQDFLNYHDREFIRNAYRGVLGREPDPEGYERYLTLLRSGVRNKVEILGGLRYSKEGREKNVKIKKLFVKTAVYASFRLPLLGYCVKLVVSVIRLPRMLKDIQRDEALAHERFLRHEENLQALSRSMESRLSQINDVLSTAADIQSVDELGRQVLAKANVFAADEARKQVSTKADLSAVNELGRQILAKANVFAADEARKQVSTKADLSAVIELGKQVATKASASAVSDLGKQVSTKAELAAVNELGKQVATKANASAVSDLGKQVSTKAELAAVDELGKQVSTKASLSAANELGRQIFTKANVSAVDELVKHVSTKADLAAVNELGKQVATKADVPAVNAMKSELDELRKRLPDPISEKRIKDALVEEEHRLDAMYVTFEDQFRGTREHIKARQKAYLPYLEHMKGGTKKAPILDVGSGRGEWLELLQENGFTVRGIDSNRMMIQHCKASGFDVVESDAMLYLKNQKEGAFSAITGFQVVEHITLKSRICLFDEALRTLKPGGVIIFETPNPENLIVGACNFYFDPTHLRPIPPMSLKFIAEARGFEKVEIKRLHPMEYYRDASNSQLCDEKIRALFTNEQDYAVIGYKPRGA